MNDESDKTDEISATLPTAHVTWY